MSTSKLTRRAALKGGASATALAAAAAVAAIPATADPHPAWVEEMESNTAIEGVAYRMLVGKHGHDFFDQIDGYDVRQYKTLVAEKMERWRFLMSKCADTPAYSPEGCLAKAFLLWKALHIGDTGHEMALVMGLMRDLQAMSASPPSTRAANAYREGRRVWSTEADMAKMEGGAL
jgi:hypothetical protein